MAPAIGFQTVRENLHACLRGIAMECYNGFSKVWTTDVRYGDWIDVWVVLLLLRFDMQNVKQDSVHYIARATLIRRRATMASN